MEMRIYIDWASSHGLVEVLGGMEVVIYWFGDRSHCSPDLASSKFTKQYTALYVAMLTIRDNF